MTADNWLLDIKLRVTGRGRVGADGMVKEFSFTKSDIDDRCFKCMIQNL
jgi:hypothetical protein